MEPLQKLSKLKSRSLFLKVCTEVELTVESSKQFQIGATLFIKKYFLALNKDFIATTPGSVGAKLEKITRIDIDKAVDNFIQKDQIENNASYL